MIGTLTKRILFKKSMKTKDSRGSWTESEQNIATIWGAISSLNALEIQKYRAILPDVSGKIIIRYREDIDSGCSGYFRNKKYDILGIIDPAEDNKYLKLFVKEVVIK